MDLLLVKVTRQLLTDANYTDEDIKRRLDSWDPDQYKAVLLKSDGIQPLD